MKNFSELFQCKFNGDDPDLWTTSLRDDFICYQGTHLKYVIVSGFLLFTYYMSSVTLFPNFQFDEPSLDIKFSANYVIIKTQTEVLIDFSTILLNDANNAYQMAILEKGLSSFATGFIFVYILWKKPCIIRNYNSVEAVFALLEFTSQVWTLVMLIFKNSTVGIIGLSAMTFAIVCVSLVVLIRRVRQRGGVSGKKDAGAVYDKIGNDMVGLLALGGPNRTRNKNVFKDALAKESEPVQEREKKKKPVDGEALLKGLFGA